MCNSIKLDKVVLGLCLEYAENKSPFTKK
jgi:hypothetical protein